LPLPVVVVAAAHLGVLGRWPVPCRTVAWVLLWSLPVGIVAIRFWHRQPLLGPSMAWPIALVVLGWRLVKALQDSKQYGRPAGGVVLAAPYALATASRFSTRIAFPSYTAAQLGDIARSIATQAGDRLEPGALPVLDSIFVQAVGDGRIDALGNGRFARTLFERACASRDVRVSLHGEAATAAELTTVLAADVQAAYRELAG
jgi:hypothetical protein